MKITIEDGGKVYESVHNEVNSCLKCCFNTKKPVCKEPLSEICNLFDNFYWREVRQEPIVPMPTIKTLDAKIGKVEQMEITTDNEMEGRK